MSDVKNPSPAGAVTARGFLPGFSAWERSELNPSGRGGEPRWSPALVRLLQDGLSQQSQPQDEVLFSLFTRKTPGGASGSYFLAKVAFSGAKKKKKGINQEIKKAFGFNLPPVLWACRAWGPPNRLVAVWGWLSTPAPAPGGLCSPQTCTPGISSRCLQSCLEIQASQTRLLLPRPTKSHSVLAEIPSRSKCLLPISCGWAVRCRDYPLGADISPANPQKVGTDATVSQ